MNLENKVIVVTGGSGLLGKEIINNISKHNGISINADIVNKNELASGKVYCDIADRNTVENMTQKVIDKYGKIDGWVNNAYPRTEDWGNKFEDIKSVSWNKNIEMHLVGYFNCNQVAFKAMKNQKCGSIVNISSVYGLIGPDFSLYENTDMTMPAAYSAIKGGIINFTRFLAAQFGKFNIRVNCVSLGGIKDKQSNEFIKKYERKTPLKRMGLPKDIAPSVTFLLSDEAMYITGHNLVVDGGFSIV